MRCHLSLQALALAPILVRDPEAAQRELRGYDTLLDCRRESCGDMVG